MKILIDECMPWKIGRHLPGHSCEGVSKAGFAGQKNGALLSLAEKSGYDVLLTVDQGIPFEQQIEGRHISLIVIRAPSNKMNVLLPHIPFVLQALTSIKAGQVIWL
jgi:hypothetical protein